MNKSSNLSTRSDRLISYSLTAVVVPTIYCVVCLHLKVLRLLTLKYNKERENDEQMRRKFAVMRRQLNCTLINLLKDILSRRTGLLFSGVLSKRSSHYV
jgi:hypothetical protein